MYCLDTSVVVDLFRGDKAIKAKLEEVKRFNVNVSITAPSLAELFKGAYLASRPEEAALLVRDFAKSISLLELSKKSCELFGKDFAFLKKNGKPVPEFDLLIGSIAKAEGKILVTRDGHFKGIPDLRVEVW